MPLSPRHRRELIAIVALLVGVFVGLTLLPLDLTGPAGRALGRFLWQYLGAGAAVIPILGIALGLAGFGRLGATELWRVAVLFGGLILLVPYALAIVLGVRLATDVPPDYAQWTAAHRLVGVAPALLAAGVTSVIGTAGAVIVLLLALSGLTIVTLDWHPFRKLAGAAAGAAGAAESPGKTVPFAPPTVLEEEEEEDTEAAPPAPTRGAPWSGLLRARPRWSGDGKGGEEVDQLPPVDLLAPPPAQADAGEEELDRLGQVLIDTLATFHVEGKIVGRTTGPVVTQFEVAPAPGVKVGRIAALADDLALAMRAQSIRIVAPIPGKAAVGVEVPNPTARIVTLRELIETGEWDRTRGTLPIALGRDLEGKPIIADLAKMPHFLIAGATGSGKSVCINTIITSLVYRYTPRELRMLMIDPKMVELSAYNALPHLRHAVVTDNREAAQVFKWTIHEMENRYELFHASGARNIHDYNRRVGDRGPGSGVQQPGFGVRDPGSGGSTVSASASRTPGPAPRTPVPDSRSPLPYVVIIVDELADLMMTVQAEVEKPLAILAQKARATGIHLVLATQRPSVNVITGLIKANFPSRVAFRVAAKVDSRTVLDQNGAEALLGNGDMLFLPPGRSEPIRVQGAFIGTEETEAITEWYQARQAARDAARRAQGLLREEEEDILAVVREIEAAEAAAEAGGVATPPGQRDALFREAAETCIQHQLGSTSLLQRKLRIGYGRAARIIDQLHEAGILGPPDGSRPREVLIGMGQLDEYCS
ncbi:MAG: DNA translocase FtsK [Gemmatimonadetes bacterium]|nr:DNA translocase FtsK [Gemmatimonadota bacterium]